MEKIEKLKKIEKKKNYHPKRKRATETSALSYVKSE